MGRGLKSRASELINPHRVAAHVDLNEDTENPAPHADHWCGSEVINMVRSKGELVARSFVCHKQAVILGTCNFPHVIYGGQFFTVLPTIRSLCDWTQAKTPADELSYLVLVHVSPFRALGVSLRELGDRPDV
jgi:hypothetical protein